VIVAVFPALHRKSSQGQGGEIILIEGEAACFYHHEKRAVHPCDACGRFLCALCCITVNQTKVCPACFETGHKKGTLEGVASRRKLYDSAALSLALIPPLLTCGFATPLSAPAAIAVAVYGWNRTSSVVPRGRIRAVLAVVLGIVEIALLGVAAVAYYRTRS
jgi:hypothetical protein